MDRTIAAVATAPGKGAIAIIRLSGKQAIEIADKVYSGKTKLVDAPSHTVHYGFIKADGEKIDEVLVTLMRAPKTFTREDVVEISTHGGIVTTKRVLDVLIDAGAYPAEPGEFTKRAFLNGRIDLSQSEAVIDIINADNDLSRRNAMSQLGGALSKEIKALRAELVHLAAQMQVIIDYPDEDLADVDVNDISRVCGDVWERAFKILKTADNGQIVRDGIRTAIVGKPNVGKSSLLNALARYERAIVTDIAGTTRDIIEEKISLNGIPVVLVDTAGIRETDDTVEKIGVERSKQSLNGADLVLVMLDASRDLSSEDMQILDETQGKKRIVLVNKNDIALSQSFAIIGCDDEIISISAKTGEGLEKLAEKISDMYNIGEIERGNGVIITNMRHRNALKRACDALKRTVDAIDCGMPSDIASIDINEAIFALGEITGETVSDSIVEDIFHSFCVGK